MLLIATLAATAACTSATSPGAAAKKYADEYGGSIDAYRSILSSTDCDRLDEEFWTANERFDNALTDEMQLSAFGIMEASRERSEEVCS